MIKSRPIIFSGNMVRAILDGNKSHTRRPIGRYYGEIGDELWVKEKCAYFYYAFLNQCVIRYDTKEYPERYVDNYPKGIKVYIAEKAENWKWRSPRFMHKWASRITLVITGKREERLQEINRKDITKEGFLYEDIPNDEIITYEAKSEDDFIKYWDELYKNKPEYQWNANPEIRVIDFKRKE